MNYAQTTEGYKIIASSCVRKSRRRLSGCPRHRTVPSEILARFARRFRAFERPGRRPPGILHDPRSPEAASTQRTSLHAKCIAVDSEMSCVSSADFTEAAQVRDIEAGALIRPRAFAERPSLHFEPRNTAGLLKPPMIAG